MIRTHPSSSSKAFKRLECPECGAENTLARTTEVEMSGFDSVTDEVFFRVTNETIKSVRCWGCGKPRLSLDTCAEVPVFV